MTKCTGDYFGTKVETILLTSHMLKLLTTLRTHNYLGLMFNIIYTFISFF